MNKNRKLWICQITKEDSGITGNTDNDSSGFFNLTRSQGPFAFYRVFPVIFDIPVIINDINAGSKKTKSDKPL